MAGIDDTLRRVPPQSVEAEQSVLGGIMLDNNALDRLTNSSDASGTPARRTARSSAACSACPSATSRSI